MTFIPFENLTRTHSRNLTIDKREKLYQLLKNFSPKNITCKQLLREFFDTEGLKSKEEQKVFLLLE